MVIPIATSPTTVPNMRTLVGSQDAWSKALKALQGQGRHNNEFVAALKRKLSSGSVRSVTLSEGEAQKVLAVCGVL